MRRARKGLLNLERMDLCIIPRNQTIALYCHKRRSVSDAGVSMIEMAGSYRKYRQIKKEIDTRGLWKIVEGHSHANHSCRLVTLSDEILSSFREEEDDSFSQE